VGKRRVAWVRGISVAFGFMTSMIVGDSYIAVVLTFPLEDDAPLFVDADGMESGELALKKLQVIAGRMAKVLGRHRLMDGNELVTSKPEFSPFHGPTGR
jgi:hypothetical protein